MKHVAGLANATGVIMTSTALAREQSRRSGVLVSEQIRIRAVSMSAPERALAQVRQQSTNVLVDYCCDCCFWSGSKTHAVRLILAASSCFFINFVPSPQTQPYRPAKLHRPKQGRTRQMFSG